MRKLNKSQVPLVLSQNHANWLSEYLAEPRNPTKKFRYRHPDIKSQIKSETNSKCIYCESKIGATSPGDIEHKKPSSLFPNEHFTWENLALACNECNRRKNDSYSTTMGFIDPYRDDVESMLIHLGPLVIWQNGNQLAEYSLKILKLCTEDRIPLIVQKIGKIREAKERIERYNNESNQTLKEILLKEILELAEEKSEYSGMIKTLLRQENII